MLFMEASLIWLAVLVGVSSAGQDCLSCSGVEGEAACQHHVTCDADEVCFMHSYITESGSAMFDFGCGATQICHHAIGPIFGRRSEGHHAKCTVFYNDTRLCNRDLKCDHVSSTPPSKLPSECSDVKDQNIGTASGVYTIYPDGTTRTAVQVYCQFDSSGTAWTVIQRRYNGSVDFYKNWQAYKNGFGSPYGEYWLGNDVIHELTSNANHDLRIELMDFEGISKYAEYTSFHIGSEQNGYILTLFNYSGNAGDGLSSSCEAANGMKFSTYDEDNDKIAGNCAISFKGAWWYRSCHCANLNGQYLSGHHDSDSDGVNWNLWRGNNYSLKSVIMMIRKY